MSSMLEPPCQPAAMSSINNMARSRNGACPGLIEKGSAMRSPKKMRYCDCNLHGFEAAFATAGWEAA